MTVLDTNVVGIVPPTIARDLGASFADIEWVISTYVLCFASVLLSAGTPMHFFEPAAGNPDAFFRAEFVQRPR
jgi:MFS family permease